MKKHRVPGVDLDTIKPWRCVFSGIEFGFFWDIPEQLLVVYRFGADDKATVVHKFTGVTRGTL